jgi:hypothetical protein
MQFNESHPATLAHIPDTIPFSDLVPPITAIYRKAARKPKARPYADTTMVAEDVDDWLVKYDV